jgi:RNA polymerase-interacting CarD/CdnL/TRCF family regulator
MSWFGRLGYWLIPINSANSVGMRLIVGQAQLCGLIDIVWDSRFERLLGNRSRERARGRLWYNLN